LTARDLDADDADMPQHGVATAPPRFREIDLNVDWVQGRGPRAALPNLPGVYAEIHWPSRAVRIGETGRSIRAKIGHDLRWFTSMEDGTAGLAQLRRTLPIALTARKTGPEGFEFYVVSCDPRLLDKGLRQEVERFMFTWVGRHPHYVDWNRRSVGVEPRRGPGASSHNLSRWLTGQTASPCTDDPAQSRLS
jgi:hypothetical protein